MKIDIIKTKKTKSIVQILNETAFHSVNTHGKGMNPTILPPVMCKWKGRVGSFNLGMATGLGERKTVFKIRSG